MAPATFFFDFISPYAYLAWAMLKRRGEPVILQPILFAALLKHGGQLGPAEIPAKRRWLMKDTLRYARRHDLPFGFPASHPFRPLTALRISQTQVAGDDQPRVVEAIFEHGWVNGGEMGSDDAISTALLAAGLDGPALVDRASDPSVKASLMKATDAAIGLGVFGVPTLEIAGELFWGADRLDDAFAHQSGELVVGDDDVKDALARPASARR